MAKDEQSPLFYERPAGGITRASFRLLILLTCINTILLGSFVMGPGLGNYLKQQWAEYKQAQAAKIAQAQADALQQSSRRQLLPVQQHWTNPVDVR